MTIYRRDVLGEFGRTEKLGLDINRVHLEVRRRVENRAKSEIAIMA